ncbi:MAG: hypothetical protein JJU45_10635 [Acidimicrobiia bacterium]|nr:hypothetical protein [Acidimicrobiia bacterium]
MTDRSGRRRRAVALVGVLIALAVGPPVGAQDATSVTPDGADIAVSASCLQGDIDITYTAVGAERTVASFTDDAGRVLDGYDEVPFAADYSGTEHILLDAAPPVPTAGTVVGVYVMVGAADPTATTAAEFFVAWRCDTTGNDEGGSNEVLLACVGPYGSVPRTVADAAHLLDGDAPQDCPTTVDPLDPTTTTASPAGPATVAPAGPARPARPAVPVRAVPTYTG